MPSCRLGSWAATRSGKDPFVIKITVEKCGLYSPGLTVGGKRSSFGYDGWDEPEPEDMAQRTVERPPGLLDVRRPLSV